MDRLYLLGGKTPPDDNTMDYLVEEAANIWARIGMEKIHKAVTDAVIFESPQAPNIGSVVRVFNLKQQPG